MTGVVCGVLRGSDTRITNEDDSAHADHLENPGVCDATVLQEQRHFRRLYVLVHEELSQPDPPIEFKIDGWYCVSDRSACTPIP